MAAAEQQEKETQQSTLATIASNPLTVACFMVLAERTASPKELSDLLLVDLGLVSYRIRKLLKVGAIEEVGSRQRRGATEHFYRAIEMPYCSDEDWREMTLEERTVISRDILQRLVAELSWALEEGTFDSRHDRTLYRHPRLDLDAQGWQEVNELHHQMLERHLDIQARVLERRARGETTESIPANATWMLFERAPVPNACGNSSM